MPLVVGAGQLRLVELLGAISLATASTEVRTPWKCG